MTVLAAAPLTYLQAIVIEILQGADVRPFRTPALSDPADARS